MKILGIILIVIGLIALATGGLSWTRREKVVDHRADPGHRREARDAAAVAGVRRRGARRRHRPRRGRFEKARLSPNLGRRTLV